MFQAAASWVCKIRVPRAQQFRAALSSALRTRKHRGSALRTVLEEEKTEKRTTITHPTAAKEGSNAYQRREFMISDCVKMIKRDRLYS